MYSIFKELCTPPGIRTQKHHILNVTAIPIRLARHKTKVHSSPLMTGVRRPRTALVKDLQEMPTDSVFAPIIMAD